MPPAIDFRRVTDVAGAGRIVRRGQLTAANIGSTTVDAMRERQQLTDVFPGVYLVGAAELSQEEFLLACVALAGPTTWLQGESCLAEHGIVPWRSGVAHLLTTRDMASPVRTRCKLDDGGHGLLYLERTPAGRVGTHALGRFSGTSLVHAFADYALQASAGDLECAWRQASFLCQLDAPAIAAELEARPRDGGDRVADLLRRFPPVTRPGMDVRSRDGELAFLELVRDLGLPEPQVNHPMVIGGRPAVLDFFWEHIGLVVETDGPQHETEWHRLADEERDRLTVEAGMAVVRYSTAVLRADRGLVGRDVGASYDARLRDVSGTGWRPPGSGSTPDGQVLIRETNP